MAQVARPQPPLPPPDAMDATNTNIPNVGENANDNERRFLPPPGIQPNSAVFGAMNLPKPLTWQRREHMLQRRQILGRIGQLLKRNAQLVMSGNAAAPAVTGASPVPSSSSNPAASDDSESHAKTWALARKLEVLLFLNSASLLEYNNVDSLARRVQAMTASIVNKKIRREIVAPPAVDASRIRAVAAPAPMPPPPAAAVAMPSPMPTAMQMPPPPVQQTFTQMMQSAMVPPVAAAPLVPPAAIPNSSLPRYNTFPTPAHGKRSVSEIQDAGPVESVDVMAPPLAERLAKRPRLPIHQHQQQQQQQVVRASRGGDRLGQLLFRGFEELNKIVWSYVDGAQIMRSRAVCRAARVLAPLFVTSLQLSCNAIQLALNTFSAQSGGCILRECVNLKELEVVSLSSGMTFGKLSMRAMNCPQRFVVTHDDHEQIVLALSQQLRYNAFPRLTRLGLTCLFTNEEADGEADVLLNNLMTGCCPQLEELCLPGNSFGDYGAMKIAQMLRSGVCPKLTRLDLRRNFISEEGIRSVCHALADGFAPQLVELCLGANTITDSCFHHVLFAMESRKLDKLRFLGIEMNYLTATSMEMLGRTIGKMVCPLLSQISYSDNSVSNADAKRVIATAVYQERMFRLRQQQLRHQQRQTGRRDGASAQYPDQYHGHQQQQLAAGGSSVASNRGLVPTQATSFPYGFPAATNARGSGGAAYFSEANYSSGDDDDDEPYSSEGE